MERWILVGWCVAFWETSENITASIVDTIKASDGFQAHDPSLIDSTFNKYRQLLCCMEILHESLNDNL